MNKKTIFTTVFAFAILVANAQIKVWTGGKTYMGNTSTIPLSQLSVGGAGNSLFQIYGYNQAFLPADWDFPGNDPFTPVCFDGFGHPKYFEIDYLRYYKLNVDCSDDLTYLCVPTSYSRAVKKSITTNPSCTPTFNPTTLAGSYTLRAVDHVTLNEGVVINPTSVGYFAIQTMACPQ